ncbi:MAG: Glutathione-binding protein GsiB precursor [Syntrophorhabdus sp. PtaU1.Bin050]|nr:MAG: Glutathione-binding protein GsiB precursor [Syntrophorhabdus sp. PtaU1.Bin050]
MDPHLQFEEKNDNIHTQIFDLLLKMDIDGNPAPNLAKSWTRLNERTVQFKLRTGVTFHNGEACDARAVKFSIERNISSKTNSPSYHVLSSIERVDVIDSYTFNIVTKHPDGILLNRLCVAGYVVPPGYIRNVGNTGFEKHPIGTGPFRFSKWIRGSELVLERSAAYWGSPPDVGRIVFSFADSRRRVDLLLNGKVDMITDFDPQSISSIEENGFKTIKEPSFSAVTINFNLIKKGSPFQSKKVRKAFNHAVNMDELIAKVKMGYGIRRATLGVPGEFGYNPYIKPYSYNPERAIELLRQAGYEKGLTVSLLVDDTFGGASNPVALELKRQLTKVGVNLVVKGGNGAMLLVESRRKANAPPFQADLFMRTCPDAMAHIIFREGIVVYDSKSPWSLVNCPNLDRLLSKIIHTIDPGKQQKLCYELERMVHEECLSLFAYQEIKLYAMPYSINYEPHVTGMLNLSEAKVIGD